MMIRISLCYILLLGFLPVFSQTQKEIIDDTDLKLKAVEIQLSKTYNRILEEYKTDQDFIKNLVASQALWEKFIEAEIKMKFPGSPSEYGSSYSMCLNIYKYDLVVERTKKLKIWLEGIEEGDVCIGSVKLKK